MANPWVGIQPGKDPVAWARLLSRAHNRVLEGAQRPAIVREVIGASWDRCRSAGIDPERHVAPMVHEGRETAARWEEHPLARFAPLVDELLSDFARDARHIVVISDADGCLLWSSGNPRVLAASTDIGFVPGRLWSEEVTGTNGVGTAIALDHPVQIFSAEHFSRQVHPWTCSGAPVHDPETGAILGVIDLSSGIRAAHPSALALVTAAARTIEAHLRREAAERHEQMIARYLGAIAGSRDASALVSGAGKILAASPEGWLPDRAARLAASGRPLELPGVDLVAEPLGEGCIVWGSRAAPPMPRRLRVRALGRGVAELDRGPVPQRLSARRSEILVLLALHPGGLSAAELARELYGSEANVTTVRAEISRLRRVLPGIIAADPYRLEAEVDADFLDVAALVADGRLAPARELYAGPLLPSSSAPAIVAARRRLERALAP